MGQKSNPVGFRAQVRKNWKSNWYASKQEFAKLFLEDLELRKILRKKPCCQGAAGFTMKRMGDKLEITIHTSRPGLVIGKKGAEIDQLKNEIKKITNKEIWIEVEEIKRPDLSAQLVAESIASQLEKRISYRKAMKRAIQSSMDSGAVGIKVQVSGRIGGAEIARTEWYKEGKIPLQNLRFDIDYAAVRAETTYGTLGVKVWVNRGEFYEKKT